MTPYTAFWPHSGEIIARGLSLVEAAKTRLDDQAETVEASPGVWELRSAGRTMWSGWVPNSALVVSANTRAEAEIKLARLAITANWDRVPTVMTDADYDADQATIAAEAHCA